MAWRPTWWNEWWPGTIGMPRRSERRCLTGHSQPVRNECAIHGSLVAHNELRFLTVGAGDQRGIAPAGPLPHAAPSAQPALYPLRDDGLRRLGGQAFQRQGAQQPISQRQHDIVVFPGVSVVE